MDIFEKFFKTSSDLFCVTNGDGFFVELSASWCHQMGWTEAELKSKRAIEFIHAEDREFTTNHQFGNQKSALHYITNRFLHKDGSERWLSWSYHKSEENDGSVYSVARDITGIRKNNMTLEALMVSLDDLVLLVDESGHFLDLWTGNEDLLFKSREEIVGNSIREVFGLNGISFESILHQALTLNRSLSTEFQLPKKTSWFSAKVTPIRSSSPKRLASFLIRDITERIEADHALDLERGKLLESSKMATLGEMAAGIAHEINNPLAIIQGKAWLLKKQLNEEKIDTKLVTTDLQVIHDTTIRISKIIHGLKTFARNGDADPFVETPLAIILDETLALCREKFKNEGVQLHVKGARAANLSCQAVQISQVLLNLLSNAFDAVEKLPDPWVEIQINETEEHLEISVRDCGLGIPPVIQDKIMQPFFTTKDVGKGTGLGLSITKGIIEAHRGQFYYNKGDTHTCFVLKLPKKQPENMTKQTA